MKNSPIKLRSFGQGMTEYIIIVALIAVAAIAVYQLFGKTVRNQTAGIVQEVAGQDGTAAIQKAGEASQAAQSQAAHDTTLSNYGNQKGKASGGGGAGAGGGE